MKIDVKGPNKTVKQIIDELRNEHGLECNMLILGKRPYYNEMQAEHKARLSQTIEELYVQLENAEIYEGKRYIPFMISATTLDGDEASCPTLRYILN